MNCVHFSPTDHIIAFSGMFIGQGSLISGQPITAPVFVYKHKANNSSSQKRSNILPSLEVITPSNSTRTDQCELKFQKNSPFLRDKKISIGYLHFQKYKITSHFLLFDKSKKIIIHFCTH